MRHLILLVLASATLASCAGYGGGSSPAGGGKAAPAAPSAAPAKSPLPSGNPDVDNYGY